MLLYVENKQTYFISFFASFLNEQCLELVKINMGSKIKRAETNKIQNVRERVNLSDHMALIHQVKTSKDDLCWCEVKKTLTNIQRGVLK